MAKGLHTNIPVEVLPEDANVYKRTNIMEDISYYLVNNYTDEEVDHLNELIQSIRLGVMNSIIQDAMDNATPSEAIDRLNEWCNNYSWPRFNSIIETCMYEFDYLDDKRKKELKELFDTLVNEIILLIVQMINAGGTKSRKKARLIIILRYSGYTTDGWYVLAKKYSISELSLRNEMRKINLPTSHI